MEKLKSQVPDFQKEIQIQPIIYQKFQPVITKVIQPVINKKIQPVVHKEIQPIVDQEIQPVITKVIQPVITRKIQPVIFNENQTNIEGVIQQLEQSHKQNNTNIIEKHITNEEVVPSTQTETKNIQQIKVEPYIMKEEIHITQKIVEPKTETITENIEIVEYVPYIKNKNGEILPYEKKGKQSVVKYIPHTDMQNKCENNKSNKNSTQMIETIIAVNFVNTSLNINYPMACKITDIFSKVEDKLYQEFPELKHKNYYFISNGKVIDRSLTFEQNKIKTGNTILINENLINN